MTVRERQALVLANLGIAYAVMRALRIHKAGWQDAEGVAMLALTAAAERYDGRCRFSTWAWLKVSWALRDHLDRESRHRGLSELDEEQHHAGGLDPETMVQGREIASRITSALASSGAERPRGAAARAAAERFEAELDGLGLDLSRTVATRGLACLQEKPHG